MLWRYKILLVSLAVPLAFAFAKPLTASNAQAPMIEKKTVQAVVSSTLPILPEDLLAAGGCESNSSPKNKPRQINGDGTVVQHVNRNGSIDYGSFQINSVHLPEAKKLGLDFIHSEQDNYKMALIIYKSQGIKAWAGYDASTKNCSYYKSN